MVYHCWSLVRLYLFAVIITSWIFIYWVGLNCWSQWIYHRRHRQRWARIERYKTYFCLLGLQSRIVPVPFEACFHFTHCALLSRKDWDYTFIKIFIVDQKGWTAAWDSVDSAAAAAVVVFHQCTVHLFGWNNSIIKEVSTIKSSLKRGAIIEQTAGWSQLIVFWSRT